MGWVAIEAEPAQLDHPEYHRLRLTTPIQNGSLGLLHISTRSIKKKDICDATHTTYPYLVPK